jgi:hypothetical protein
LRVEIDYDDAALAWRQRSSALGGVAEVGAGAFAVIEGDIGDLERRRADVLNRRKRLNPHPTRAAR